MADANGRGPICEQRERLRQNADGVFGRDNTEFDVYKLKSLSNAARAEALESQRQFESTAAMNNHIDAVVGAKANSISRFIGVAKKFRELGFNIKATEGTKAFLAENGIESERILKMHEGRPNIADGITNGEIQLVINTPSGKLSVTDDSYIRKSAISRKVPYITTVAAAKAAAEGIAACRDKAPEVRPLQDYHSDIV